MEEKLDEFISNLSFEGFSQSQINQLVKLYKMNFDFSYMNNEVDVNVLRKLYDVLKNPRTLDMRFLKKQQIIDFLLIYMILNYLTRVVFSLYLTYLK